MLTTPSCTVGTLIRRAVTLAAAVLALLCVAAAGTADGPKEDRARKLARLFAATDTDDIDARRGAQEAIEAFAGPNDLEAVARAARDTRVRVRLAAIKLLWRYRDCTPDTSSVEPPDVPSLLLANMRHQDTRVRVAAIIVAQRFAVDSPALVKALAAALDDQAIDDLLTVADYAAVVLGGLGTRARPAYPALLRAAEHSKQQQTRDLALGAIGGLAAADRSHQPLLVGFLIRRLERGTTFSDRASAASALRSVGPGATPAVLALRKAYRCEGLTDPEERAKIRKWIAETYQAIGPAATAALPDLLPVLSDKTECPIVRANIVGFVRKLQDDGKAAWPMLRRIAIDITEDDHVREQARAALADHDPKK